MPHLILLLAVVGVVAAATATGAVRRHLRTGARVEPSLPPHSLVRVLTSEDEFRAAVQRAAHFEQKVADAVRTRTRRYEAMVLPATVTDIGTRPALLAGRSGQDPPHSA